jgi:hypothetical protein
MQVSAERYELQSILPARLYPPPTAGQVPDHDASWVWSDLGFWVLLFGTLFLHFSSCQGKYNQ